jgi:Flp pilus assembly protein CpaB
MTAAIFAILIGLGGAFAVRQYINKPEPVAAPTRAPNMVVVPVAIRDLVAGQKLTINDIMVQRMAPEEFRKSQFAAKSFMSNTDQIAGRTLRLSLAKGNVFDPTLFYPDGMGPGVADSLRPGFRAVSVPINDIGSVAGFARPGSVVDVIFRSQPRDGRPEMTMTLLERVEVLAMDEVVLHGARSEQATRVDVPAKVTLAVTPAQAKALKVVEGRGEISLALRNPEEGDDELISLNLKRASTRVTLDQLLGPSKRGTQMEIYRA